MIYQIGIILILISTAFIFPVFISLFLGLENEYIPIFLSLFILCILPAFVIMSKFEERELKVSTLFYFIVISWILFFILGSLPYIFILKLNPIDALFQSISGLTTTGMRVIGYDMPKIMLIYEAYLQWIGGLSIVIMFLTFISPYPSITRLHSLLEFRRKFETGLVLQAQNILFTYIYLTFLSIVILYIFERDPFLSIYYAFTTLSTGGFSYEFNDLSFISKIVIGIFATIGSINFFILYKFIFKKDLSLFKDIEFRGIIILTIISSIFLHKILNLNIVESILQSLFVITTTGYSLIDIDINSPATYFMLILAAIGGGYGSTAGGIKIFRIYAFFKSLAWYFERVSEEHKVSVLKITSKKVESEEALLLVIFVALYSLTIIFGVILLTILGRDLNEAFLMIISAQATLGYQTTLNLSDIEKLILCFYMFAGRIELIPIFIVLRNLTKLKR